MSKRKTKLHVEDYSLRSIYRIKKKIARVGEHEFNGDVNAREINNRRNKLSDHSSGSNDDIDREQVEGVSDDDNEHEGEFADDNNADNYVNNSDSLLNRCDGEPVQSVRRAEDGPNDDGDSNEDQDDDDNYEETSDDSNHDGSDDDNNSDNYEDTEEEFNDSDLDAGHHSEHEEEPEPQPDPEEDPPLYDGAPLSVAESLTCILTFALRYALTGTASAALLELIFIHCPRPNYCKKTLYYFKKYFSSYNAPLIRKFYCSRCLNKLELYNSVCESCSQDDLSETPPVSYFINISIMDQLRTFYKRPGFFHLLQWKFQRIKKNLNNYEDIYDGQVYRNLCRARKFLSNPHNISFTWNTDGVKLFKSSNFEIWPVYLSINELPLTHRMRKENLLLVGLWFGNKKPLPSLFLEPICNELDVLSNGVNFEVPDRNNIITVKGRVICGTCDLPAKSLFLNMKQFNGEYGCQKCCIRTELLDENSSKRIYPYREQLNMRTQEETNNLATEAAATGNEIFGVKGPSAVSRMSQNYIHSTSIDYMHCVILGVVRALLLLWFDGPNSLLWDFINIVEKKICAFTPPSFIPRLPRSITEHLLYLKAHELKTWFFYYSLPILETIMSNTYLEHYKLFVHAIYLLNQESISENDIIVAENLLHEFVSQYEDLYGRENMTANLHLLLHLPQVVRDFGPLFCTSCFPYEDANGTLKGFVTGTKFSQLQICTGVSIFQNLPEIKKKLIPDNPPSNYCEKLTSKRKKYKSHRISNKFSVVGTMSKIVQLPRVINQALVSASRIHGRNIKLFHRLLISGKLYTSELYKRLQKTNSMFIKYSVNNNFEFGKIYCFSKISNCGCPGFCEEICGSQYFAIVKRCRTIVPFSVQEEFSMLFIHRCEAVTDVIDVVNVNNINCLCFYVELKPENVAYIIELVNSLEME